MNYKKFKKYYSVDKAENRWQNVMNFIVLFLGIAILCSAGIYFWISKNLNSEVLPKIENDHMKLQSIEKRVEELENLSQ